MLYLFIASFVDYIGIGEIKGTGVVIFPTCSNKTCISVIILSDDLYEVIETFSISIWSKLSNGHAAVINDTYSTAEIQILPHSQSQLLY